MEIRTESVITIHQMACAFAYAPSDKQAEFLNLVAQETQNYGHSRELQWAFIDREEKLSDDARKMVEEWADHFTKDSVS